MESVASPTVSCPSHGALLHDTPTTSCNPKRAKAFSKKGLVAFQSSPFTGSCCRSGRRGTAAPASHVLLETAATIDEEGIVAEAPGLLALSSDLDWQQSVSDLREEALGGLSTGVENMAFARLSDFIDGCLHDRLLASVLQPSLVLQGGQDANEELGVRIRLEELRLQAVLQATEELASGVDSSFDWESEVAKLRQNLLKQEGIGREQSLWSAWELSRLGMDMDVQRLHDEALKSLHADSSYLTLFTDKSSVDAPTPLEVEEESVDKPLEISGTWWTLGVLAAAGLFGARDAIAIADDDFMSAVALAPRWIAPSVLAFPVVSYLLFTLYRNNVNPYARLTDWAFGLVAMAIVGNVVLITTLGCGCTKGTLHRSVQILAW